MAGLTRRGMLAGLAGAVALPARADAPLRSKVPPIRPLRGAAGVVPDAAELIAQARLGGEVGFAVADVATGTMLETSNALVPLPPASTAKVITTLYALDRLGGEHRFATRLVATGPIVGGKIQGDLILAGGGDPTLTTDDLGDMARALAAAGVTGITGLFGVWAGALPYLDAIDPSQPAWLGYNPSVSGLILNFNRVNFVWKRTGKGYEIGMDARDERFAPPVYSARVALADRENPLFTYHGGGTVEEWTVASAALGKGGSRWLPVRRPDLYAGDVFQTLARAEGCPLPAPEPMDRLPQGRTLVTHESDDLRKVLREMLKYSTNITAEAVGMTASAKAGITDHRASGEAMSAWIAAAAAAPGTRLVDHSGLAGASRMGASDMVRALVRLGPGAGLRGLMKPVHPLDGKGRAIKDKAIRIDAKTGTLNFVSSLAGYVTCAGGRELAFAIFTADVARRDAIPESQKEDAPGVTAWVKRSKRLQLGLIERWSELYDAT